MASLYILTLWTPVSSVQYRYLKTQEHINIFYMFMQKYDADYQILERILIEYWKRVSL